MIPRTEWELLVHETLSELVAGVTTLSLYQPDHPRSQAALDKLLGHLERLLAEDGELPIVLLSDDLFVKGRPFTRLSRPAETFMRRMRRRRIEHVTFRRGVQRSHLQAFLLDLAKADDSPALSQDTIQVGRVEFATDGGGGPDDREGGTGRSRFGLVRDRVTMIGESFQAILGGRHPAFTELDGLARYLASELEDGTPPQALLAGWEGEERWPAVHAHNACVLAVALARHAGFPFSLQAEIGLAALFHDVGKLFWPQELLRQELELGGKELELILDHPREGFSLMLTWGHQVPPVALVACFEHHLHYGGGGYPRLARARRPQPASSLVAVADTYSTLHTVVRGQRGLPVGTAEAWLAERAGNQLDPAWCAALFETLGIPQRAGK